MDYLDALEILIKQIETNDENADFRKIRKAHEIIKTALIKLEDIEQPLSRRALYALKRIRQETCVATYNRDFDKDYCCDIIEEALNEFDELKREGK